MVGWSQYGSSYGRAPARPLTTLGRAYLPPHHEPQHVRPRHDPLHAAASAPAPRACTSRAASPRDSTGCSLRHDRERRVHHLADRRVEQLRLLQAFAATATHSTTEPTHSSPSITGSCDTSCSAMRPSAWRTAGAGADAHDRAARPSPLRVQHVAERARGPARAAGSRASTRRCRASRDSARRCRTGTSRRTRSGSSTLARDLQRDVRDQSRRSADEQSFLAREAPRHRERLLVAHRADSRRSRVMSSVPGILSCPIPSTLYGAPSILSLALAPPHTRRGSTRPDRRR